MFGRMMFFSSSGVVNPLPGQNLYSAGVPTASSRLRVSADGWIRHVSNGTPFLVHQWHTGGGDTSLYVRFTLISGDAPNIGTLNTWQQLNADRDIGNSVSTLGAFKSSVIKVEIATDSGGTNIISTSSPNYTVEAEVPN
jgi:hypothetical protein